MLKKTKVSVVVNEDTFKLTELVTVEEDPTKNTVSSITMPFDDFLDLLEGMLKKKKGAKAIEFKTSYRGFVEIE